MFRTCVVAIPLGALGLLVASPPAAAFVIGITPGTRTLYLQVGTGSLSPNFNVGGTPANNATVNEVSVAVPGAAIGTGPLAMTSNSAVASSPYDGFAFCTPPAQVYIGGFYRAPGTSGAAAATLSVTAPTNLSNATGQTIPFSSISWTSGGAGDVTPTIPSGQFVGGTQQTLLSVARNTWFESCLAFTYANNQLVAAGTFTGRVTYTLTLP